MRKDDQRDASIDTFLRNGLRNGTAAGAAGPCVDAETIAAWTEGSLSPADAAAIEIHLSSCAACQQLLAVFARSAPAPEVAPSVWQRWRLQWAVPIAAAATAAAIWVAIPDDQKKSAGEEFAVADSALSSTQSQPVEPAAKSDPVAAEAPAPALEQSESSARRDSDSSRRTQAQNGEVRQEKSELESDRLARAREAAPAAPTPQSGVPALADAAAAPPAAAPPATLAQQRQAAFAPAEVASPDPAIRWRVLSTGQLERTTNAGQTWEPVALTQKVASIRAMSATTAVATSVDGRQFRTDDQGKTWNPVKP